MSLLSRAPGSQSATIAPFPLFLLVSFPRSPSPTLPPTANIKAGHSQDYTPTQPPAANHLPLPLARTPLPSRPIPTPARWFAMSSSPIDEKRDSPSPKLDIEQQEAKKNQDDIAVINSSEELSEELKADLARVDASGLDPGYERKIFLINKVLQEEIGMGRVSRRATVLHSRSLR